MNKRIYSITKKKKLKNNMKMNIKNLKIEKIKNTKMK